MTPKKTIAQPSQKNCWFLSTHNFWESMDAVVSGDPLSGKSFGYVGVAFSLEKDPSYKNRYLNEVMTAAFEAGDVPWECFKK